MAFDLKIDACATAWTPPRGHFRQLQLRQKWLSLGKAVLQHPLGECTFRGGQRAVFLSQFHCMKVLQLAFATVFFRPHSVVDAHATSRLSRVAGGPHLHLLFGRNGSETVPQVLIGGAVACARGAAPEVTSDTHLAREDEEVVSMTGVHAGSTRWLFQHATAFGPCWRPQHQRSKCDGSQPCECSGDTASHEHKVDMPRVYSWRSSAISLDDEAHTCRRDPIESTVDVVMSSLALERKHEAFGPTRKVLRRASDTYLSFGA